MQDRRNRGGIAACFLAASLAAGAEGVVAQQQWQNSPLAPSGNPVIPWFEGWYDNGDGTLTLSFGYLNRNPRDVVEIPHGPRNRLEPAEFDGKQPTHFMASRNRGMFAITIPESRRDLDIWWYLTDAQGNEYKVPGRARTTGYQLDWLPRPHGSLPPLMWFTNERDARRGPEGIFAPETLTARVGQPLTLTVQVRDESVRDATDPRFRNGIPVNIAWSKYQGPMGAVTFTRHPSHPEDQRPTARGRGAPPPPPDAVALPQAGGTARVIATFEAPGDYIVRAEAHNWGAPDSQSVDQCCWSNAYVRVRVTP
jgi:hypothetical protein